MPDPQARRGLVDSLLGLPAGSGEAFGKRLEDATKALERNTEALEALTKEMRLQRQQQRKEA